MTTSDMSCATVADPRPLPRWDPRRWPGWAQALGAFAISRLFVTFLLLRAARMARPRADGSTRSYGDVTNNWDGTWYERVVIQGYPSHLPIDSSHAVGQNTWAFYPLFPRLVGVLMQVTGLAWTPCAGLFSLICAVIAVVVMRSVLARVAGPRHALWAVVLFSFFPSSAVLQLPYAESPAILLLVTVFWALQRRRYLIVVPAVLLIGVTRPIAVPLALVLTVHLAMTLRDRARQGSRLRHSAGALVAWIAGAVAAVEWPAIAWYCTGVRDAYTLSMAGWRADRHIVPFLPWWQASEFYLGPLIGPILLAAALAAFGWWLWRPAAARVLSPELRVWCAGYALYLVTVLDSFTSLPRYLLPLFPLGVLLLEASRSRAYRIALTVSLALSSVVWLSVIWRSSNLAP